MKTVKWGVLGTAGIARGCTIPGMKMAEGCELYAIAGRKEEKVREYQEEFGFEKGYVGYEALLRDPEVEAVYLPLPNHLHCEWVIHALNAGKHVLCEKPIALNAAEAERMYRIARENGVVLMEAFAYLHSPYIASLQKDIADGLIGEVDYINTAFVTQSYHEDIRLHKAFGGGAVYDLGCYCTTMMESLVDSKPEFVRACAEFGEDHVDVSTTGVIRFENGVRGSFSVGMLLGKNTDFRYDYLFVHGSKGCIKSEVEYNQAGELTYTVISNGEEIKRSVNARQNYALEIEQMNRVLTTGEKPRVSEAFSMQNARLLDEILAEIDYETN